MTGSHRCWTWLPSHSLSGLSHLVTTSAEVGSSPCSGGARHSLREDVRRELACRDTTLTFDQLVDLSIRQDNLLATRGRPDGGLSVPSPSTTAPMSMKLGGAALRETGGGTVSCTICGCRGHTARRCRVGSSRGQGSRQGSLASPQVRRYHSHPEPSVAHMFLFATFPRIPSIRRSSIQARLGIL